MVRQGLLKPRKMKKPLLAFLITCLLATACAQSSLSRETQLPTIAIAASRTATVLPTESLVPSPTFTPNPDLEETTANLRLAPSLATKFESHSTTLEDDAVIAAIESEAIYFIRGLLIDRVGNIENIENASAGAPAYVLVNDVTGDIRIVAWYDATTNHVIEASTGYPLNVRDAPGIGIETGPEGEEFYVYGFAWYPRWGRIFPDPVVELLDAFYDEGIAHVRAGMNRYRTVAAPDYFGGRLSLVTWDEELPVLLEGWGTDLPAPPFMALPDSGTVDIRDVRFEEAIDSGLIGVDERTVDQYVMSNYPTNSNYTAYQPGPAVINKLLEPFRRPGRFSDLQKLIILGGLYDDRGPLAISIDFSLGGGFFVPDSREKVIRIAPSEVDLMFGYDGIYFAKLSHEMTHSVEFRDYAFIAERCWPDEDDMVETLLYVLEYMWWVQQYPGNAPYWDWEPINSGLLIVTLLDGEYQNFSC